MGLMGLIGGLIQKRPDVPEFKKVDAAAEQKSAIAGNVAALGGAGELAKGVNALNQGELLAALRGAVPGFDKAAENAGKLVEEFSAPGIPADIQKLVQNRSAARAAAGGYAGSQRSTNLEARDLGLTSLELAGKKLGAVESWLGFARQNLVAPQFDVSAMFLTPSQQIGLAVGERDRQFQREWSNSINEANNAWQTILGKEMQNTEGQIMGMVGSVLGSVGGGAAMCWVAREVYGSDNPRWLLFREWVLTRAPAWFVSGYIRFGPAVAAWLRSHPKFKAPVLRWMESKINSL